MRYFYRPQRSCDHGYVFTHVCDSVHGGLPQCMLGYHPPWRMHPRKHACTPLGSTPPQEAHSPPQKHTHTPRKHAPWEAHTPRSTHPPPGSRLQHTVNEQPVRILLECILVYMGKYILKGEPSYVGIFPVCLGMPLIFTDFQHCTWLRFTSHWKICEYLEPSLGILEKFQHNLALSLSNIKYNCAVLFWSQLYWLSIYASKYIFSYE